MYRSSGIVLAEKPSIGIEPTRLFDESRFKNHGTHTDITMVQLPSGLWVRSFNATSSVVAVSAHSSINNIFDGGGTLLAWINPASDGEGGAGQIFNKTNWDLRVRNQSGNNMQLRLTMVYSGTNFYVRTTSLVIPINTWTHLTVTYNSDDTANLGIIYLNGASVAVTHPTPTGTRSSDTAYDLFIGNNSAGGGTFDGDISLPRMANYILSPGLIKNIYEKQLRDWFL